MIRWFSTPTTYSEEEQSIARILNSISFITILAPILFLPFIPIIYPNSWSILGIVVLVILLGGTVRLLILKIHLNLAKWLLIIGIWIILTIIYFTQGGLYHPALSAYILVIILAALLRSPRAIIIVATISIFMNLILLFLEQNSALPQYTEIKFTALHIWISNTFFLIIASSFLYLAERIIETTLKSLQIHQEQLSFEIEKHKEAQVEILQLAKTHEQIAIQYQSLFNQSNDAIFILDLYGNHQAVNHRACEMLGYTAEELTSISFRGVVVPQEISKSENVLQQLLTGKKIQPYERLFYKKDGTVFPAEINVELIHDADGNPLHIQSICRDITERKQLEEEKLAAAIAYERTQVLSNIIAVVSHDFRTPLSSIRTSLHLLQKSDDTNNKSRHIQRIDEQTRIITRMVNNLTFLIKLDNNFVPNLKSIDLQQFLPVFIQKRLQPLTVDFEITYNMDKNIPLMQLDMELLETALKHLVHNAIHHSQTEKSIQINVERQSENLLIEVSDNGIGIGEEQIEHIFEHFYRSDEARQLSLNASNGLGLAIAKRVMEIHRGRVEVESRLGEGSTFRLIFPINPLIENLGDRS